MRCVFWALCVLGVLGGGCVPQVREFGEGFAREAGRQAADMVVDQLGDKVDGLGAKIGDITEKIPPPSEPTDTTLWGGLGALAAYVLGSLGKGYLRDRKARHA